MLRAHSWSRFTIHLYNHPFTWYCRQRHVHCACLQLGGKTCYRFRIKIKKSCYLQPYCLSKPVSFSHRGIQYIYLARNIMIKPLIFHKKITALTTGVAAVPQTWLPAKCIAAAAHPPRDSLPPTPLTFGPSTMHFLTVLPCIPPLTFSPSSP